MALTILMIAVGLVVTLLVTVLGGIGLTASVFSGFASIPSFIWIGLIIVIVLSLFRRK